MAFMKFVETPLTGLILIEPKIFLDARGFFMESYNQDVFRKNGIAENFIQDNISRSSKGVLRGLHYQRDPHAQGKLVRATRGAIFDVAVDIHLDSPTFGQWFGATLSEENRHALYVPPGFAHGFLSLMDNTEVTYKCTALYNPTAEGGLLWSDSAVGIQWPLPHDQILLSEKDKTYPPLAQAEIS
jgi:dTDP-4-dehydrorhamnose 3,5-epimerase